MADPTIFFRADAQELPETKLHSLMSIAAAKRQHAIDRVFRDSYLQCRQLTEVEFDKLMTAIGMLRNADDGAIERQLTAYLAEAVERQLEARS